MLRAMGVAAHDGDTISALVDLGFAIYNVQRLRLAGINTPEIVGTTGDERVRAFAAKDRTTVLTVDQPLLIRTHRTRSGEPVQSFERYVAEVHLRHLDAWSDLGLMLVEEGLAVRVTP